MTRSGGYHVFSGDQLLNSFDIDGSTHEPDRDAAEYALADQEG